MQKEVSRRIIPYSRQTISKEDVEAVVAALHDELLTQGPSVTDFELAIAAYVQNEHGALAVNSASTGLEVAYKALGVGPGSIVWLPPISYVATANAALTLGAKVGFVDVCPKTGLMDMSKFRLELERASVGEMALPNVVTVVHYAGNSADMKSLKQLSLEFGFKIVEDAAHAIGGLYQCGELIGCCRYSDAAVFSFHPVKVITAGEGGAVVFKQNECMERAVRLINNGVNKNRSKFSKFVGNKGEYWYEQDQVGLNYRMSGINAALARSQLSRIDSNIFKRRAIAKRYRDNLSVDSVANYADLKNGANHLFPILLNTGCIESKANALEFLANKGIAAGVHYIPICDQPLYNLQNLLSHKPSIDCARAFFLSAVSIPMFESLSGDEIGYVIDCVNELGSIYV